MTESEPTSIFNTIMKSIFFTMLILELTLYAAVARPFYIRNHAIENPITKDSTDFKPCNNPINPHDISPLLAGEIIPVVSLIDLSGKSISLNKAVAKKPSVLIFYRGGWCPYCSKQLSGIQLIENDLKKMGYQVIAISTDSPENLALTMDKQKLSYMLLSDADLHASKLFGIAFKAPAGYDTILPEASACKNTEKLLPVPSVFILDKQGKILFEYINPNITERISPDLLKAAASSLIKGQVHK